MMDYYGWRARGKPVGVRLNLPMLGYMVPWIREREMQPAEAFGILLGSIKRRWGKYLVTIDDFHPFDPAHLSGRPKPPPGTDLEVVGLYRRREGAELKLDGLDASFIRSSFVHPGMIYLLATPGADGPHRAAIFIQERGEIHGYTNYGEFPFDAAALRKWKPRTQSSRKWIPVTGFVAALIGLGAWFVWLREPPAAAPAPVKAPPVVQQPVPAPARPQAVEPAPKTAERPAPARTKRHKHRVKKRRGR